MQRNSLTLLEIEQRTGIKKSSMQRYVSGETGKIPMSAIEKLANLFGVYGTYLMGWEEKKNSPSEPTLTEGEQMLLNLFRQIPEDQQRVFLEMGRVYANSLNKD
jgi:transcriptional regulator with XRE-family HTH domain